MDKRLCLYCGEVLRGRIDKKFCDDLCRSAHNNRLNSSSSALLKKITRVLRRNRKVLQEIFNAGKNGKVKASAQKLQEKGFNFTYHTHSHKSRTGNTWYFCYDYGYLPLENNFYRIVRKE